MNDTAKSTKATAREQVIRAAKNRGLLVTEDGSRVFFGKKPGSSPHLRGEMRTVAVDSIVSTLQAEDRLDLTVGTIARRREQRNDHPAPIYVNTRLTLWDLEEIRAFYVEHFPKKEETICPLPSGHAHGSRPDYVAGCRCPDSRAANTAYHQELRDKKRNG